jgi:hypothetical protein
MGGQVKVPMHASVDSRARCARVLTTQQVRTQARLQSLQLLPAAAVGCQAGVNVFDNAVHRGYVSNPCYRKFHIDHLRKRCMHGVALQSTAPP